MMRDLVVVLRTSSDVEASIVRGLLEMHGIPSLISSDSPRAIFPVNVDGISEIRVSVHAEQGPDARAVIDGHRTKGDNRRVVPLRDEFGALEAALGYRFRDPGLLEHALTHTSRAHEDVTGGVVDNESLEFLGDAILGFLVADWLFREFPDLDEGEKSKLKASLVSAAVLAERGEVIDLGVYLLLGRGEEKTGGRRKPALVSDAFEAVIAAIYLDGGVDAARAFVHRHFVDHIDAARRARYERRDYKSVLQERLQARGMPLPEDFVTLESGPAHRRTFHLALRVAGETIAEATGTSKKAAEQEAARMALERLGDTA